MSRTDDSDHLPILEALQREADDAARQVDLMLEEMMSADHLAQLDRLLEGS